MLDISQLNELKSIFDKQIDKLPEKVALCLSGGIDSAFLLSMLLQHKKQVTVYTFTFENYISVDFKKAQELSKRFECEFVPIYLPVDLDILKQDILKLHSVYNCRKKTDYECVWPFLYVYPKIKEKLIVIGLGAEGDFGCTKRGNVFFRDNLDDFRDWYFNRENVNQCNQHFQLCYEYSIKSWFPFLFNEVKKFFVNKSWDELNTDGRRIIFKQPLYDLMNFGVHPKKSNLQSCSHIKEHFELLVSTDWNLHNFKSVVGILNSVNKGEISNAPRRFTMRKLV